MKLLLKCKNVTKKYRHKTALNQLNLKVEEGEILGLLGRNGAGKTTLFQIIAGLFEEDKDRVEVDGIKVCAKTKAIVAYLPDKNFIYPWMRVKDAVEFFRDFFLDFDEEKAKESIKDMDISMKDKVSSLSKGMKERLNIALTFSRNARLYILDEPFAAVDVVTREKIIDTIIKNFRKDCSIIISTHLILDVERLFDKVAFIHNGKIIEQGEIEELREGYGKSLEDTFKEILGN